MKTYLWQFGKLSLVLTLTLSLWLALTTLPAYAQGPCLVETNGDNTTDFQSADASAIQAAVDAANAGDTLRIAGTCAGVQGTGGLTQTVYISKSLTLKGGYNQDDWAAGQQPGVYTTTLDAERGGRVAVVIGDIDVTLDGLVVTGGGGVLATALPVNDHGAGIWTNSVLTLTRSSVISNLITEGNGNDGAGIYSLNGPLYIADSLIADNENQDDDGGGMYLTGGATIVRSTLQNNRTHDTSNTGGGVYLAGGSVLQISDSQFLDNYTSGTSANGGAIRMTANNVVTITNSILSGNSTAGLSANGGAIDATEGTVFIENSLIQDNHTYGAGATGGAVSHSGGVTTINNSAILSNTTTNAIGGGLFIGGGTLNISNSTIAYNRSLNPSRPGGGLAFNQFGDNQKFATLENVTLSSNSSAGEGGAIWVPRGFLTMTHVTLSDNSAITGTGGISVGVNGTVNMANSLIANSAHEDCLSVGSFNDLGYNLVEDGNCLSAGTSLSGDPLLAPLEDNGGPAQTHALLAGSPAIDVSPGGSCALSADQRGLSRPQGSGCDSGAFEAEETSSAGPLCYVNASASGANNGASWADAYTGLQAALLNMNCTEIWVAVGTYYPTGGANRAATFQLKNGVAIYGGFVGTETTRDQRDSDPATNNTILSGDIGATNVSSDNSYHVVTGGGTDNTAVLNGFTVTAGNANGGSPNNRGAGMYNNGGSPTVMNVIFNGNSAIQGGGLYNASSSPALTGVTFSSNSAAPFGGGLYNVNSSPTLTNVIFDDNSATIQGGGMFNTNSHPTLTNAVFSGNSANEGGGMLNSSSHPMLANVIFSTNTTRDGSGMANYNSNPELVNVTFSGNSATNYGGGIYNEISSPILTNVTFSSNTAAQGGGMFNYNSGPTLLNVIIANSSGGDCLNFADSGSLNPASANNLIEDTADACGLTDGVGGNIIGSDPNLGPLASNGGATQTHALLPGSLAIDAGNNGSCPATDQRGQTRPQGPHCDIGAFETQHFYTLSVNVVGSGTVTPTGGSYPGGAPVNLEATPAAGWQFGGWSGALSGSTNPAGLTMDGDKVVTATFSQIPTYTLTLNTTGEGLGSVSLTPPGGVYEAGTVVTLTATAGPGSYFAGWSGALNTANSSETLTLDSNKVVTATFGMSHTTFFPLIYISSDSNGEINGISFADEDIIVYDPTSDSWAKFFDGSDVGLNSTDLDAFFLQDDGSLLISLDQPQSLPGLGQVDDSDIIRFISTSGGEITAGGFEWYFDGSDVGLTAATEDVDNITFSPDGQLVISTIGRFDVPGGSGGQNEDLVAFTPTHLGQNTSGAWALYFDGSDLSSQHNLEDIRSAWIDPANGDIYLTTEGSFSIPGLSSNRADIFVCHPVSLGGNTQCTFSFYWDGSAHGLAGAKLDSFVIGSQATLNLAAMAGAGASTLYFPLIFNTGLAGQ